jgi:hypothetical protein
VLIITIVFAIWAENQKSTNDSLALTIRHNTPIEDFSSQTLDEDSREIIVGVSTP